MKQCCIRYLWLMFMAMVGWASMAALAQPASHPVSTAGFMAGRDYVVLTKPIEVGVKPGHVEVWEFFSYNCPHCKEFEPVLSAWEKKLPSSVVLHRVPVSFLGPNASLLQRLYYALEDLGHLDLHTKVFEAIHDKHVAMNTEKDIVDWVIQQGIAKDQFEAAFRSFSMQTKIGQVKHWQSEVGLEGVPTLLVGGRYRTDLTAAKGPRRVLDLTDYLVSQSRGGTSKGLSRQKNRYEIRPGFYK
jgi:thiol:disulfide interchange protein DsbA